MEREVQHDKNDENLILRLTIWLREKCLPKPGFDLRCPCLCTGMLPTVPIQLRIRLGDAARSAPARRAGDSDLN